MTRVHTVARAERQSKSPERNIRGWGADLDRAARPGVPREKLLPSREGMRWSEEDIPEQHARVPIFLSVERDRMTPVQGTSCPPRGLSGLLRAWGYRFGEARLARWMTLLVADRVDVAEGYLGDLLAGRIAMPSAARSLSARWRDDRAFRRAVTAGAAVAAVAVLARWQRQRVRRGH
jgi:hypothetical protein